jgi:hypothetical protein
MTRRLVLSLAVIALALTWPGSARAEYGRPPPGGREANLTIARVDRPAGSIGGAQFAQKARDSGCAARGVEARELYDKATRRNPREAGHWKKEIDLAARYCQEGKDAQATVIFNEVISEMSRELKKKN